MLDIILNEKKIVDDALEKKIINKNPTITLKALLKHYYINKMTDKDILKEQLMYFMQENYDDFIRSKWEDNITRLVNNFLNNIRKYNLKIELVDVESIEITENELNKIKELNDIILEKIAFVLLIYAKISNIIMNDTSGWINISCSTICKEAKVNLKGNDKYKAFHELYKKKYIEQQNSTEKTNIKVNYLDSSSSIAIEINQFEGVIHYYLNWIGENWKLCENCKKKWFKVKNNKGKYCNTCAKEKQLEQKKEWKRNFDKSRKIE